MMIAIQFGLYLKPGGQAIENGLKEKVDNVIQLPLQG